MAERTRSIDVIHFSAKAVIRADLLFTLPGVLLVLMNGYAMVFDRNGPRELDSVVSGIILGFQAAKSRRAWSKYTASGVRRSSAL